MLGSILNELLQANTGLAITQNLNNVSKFGGKRRRYQYKQLNKILQNRNLGRWHKDLSFDRGIVHWGQILGKHCTAAQGQVIVGYKQIWSNDDVNTEQLVLDQYIMQKLQIIHVSTCGLVSCAGFVFHSFSTILKHMLSQKSSS